MECRKKTGADPRQAECEALQRRAAQKPRAKKRATADSSVALFSINASELLRKIHPAQDNLGRAAGDLAVWGHQDGACQSRLRYARNGAQIVDRNPQRPACAGRFWCRIFCGTSRSGCRLIILQGK